MQLLVRKWYLLAVTGAIPPGCGKRPRRRDTVRWGRARNRLPPSSIFGTASVCPAALRLVHLLRIALVHGHSIAVGFHSADLDSRSRVLVEQGGVDRHGAKQAAERLLAGPRHGRMMVLRNPQWGPDAGLSPYRLARGSLAEERRHRAEQEHQKLERSQPIFLGLYALAVHAQVHCVLRRLPGERAQLARRQGPLGNH